LSLADLSTTVSEERLQTELWVMAHLRRCTVEGIPAVLVRRGARDGATVLVKINQLEAGCRVLSQVRDLDGRLGWLPALGGRLVEEPEADAYVARAVDRDPDLWVVEIEDRGGAMPFDGKILK
jgi:hypothetical protein